MSFEFTLKPAPAVAGALALSLALCAPGPWFPAALAETYEGAAPKTEAGDPSGNDGGTGASSAILKGDTEIEQLTASFEEAQAQAGAAEARAEELQGQIDEIDAELPRQQELSDEGIKQRYIMQSNPLAVVEPLLTSQSLDDFLRQVDYLELVSRKSLREFNTLNDMKRDAEQAQEAQELVLEDAAANLDEARAALSSLQDERAWNQELAQGSAAQQAADFEEPAPPDEADATDAEGGNSDASEKNKGDKKDKGDSGKKETEADSGAESSPDDPDSSADADAEEEEEPINKDPAAIPDGADWHAGRDEFIAEWAPRIDAYLEGSPLAGQGINFAAAAWKYNVDPRWSPAISNTESSKGAYCIRPHNAWGWGAADSDPYGLASEWESWEEAIDAHVAGLARGYGYTISIANAQKYCSSWRRWYNNTLAQMAQI